MKTLIRILVNPTGSHSKHYQVASDTTVLAVLISVLNLSSSGQQEIIYGMEFLGFFTALENIITIEEIPLVTKSVSLLAISNMYTILTQASQPGNHYLSSSTIAFALEVLTEWHIYAERRENPPELVRNLVYASVVLFYNFLFISQGQQAIHRDQALTTEWLENLINVISTRIIPNFGEDILITPVLL